MARRIRSRALLAILVLATAATAEDPPKKPAAPTESDPRALDLIRKADLTTYCPTAAGLASVKCTARYQMTNGTVYLLAYVLEAPGRSTIDLRTSESGQKDPWDESEGEKLHEMLDDLFDGPRLERSFAGKVLTLREGPAGTVVLIEGHELRFLSEGPLAEDSPGEENVARGVSLRSRIEYEKRGERYLRKRAALDGYGKGALTWRYEEVDGILVPTKHTAWCAGLGGTLTIGDLEINKGATGPAKLPPPAGPPSQAELDSLSVEAIAARISPPFLGPSPDPVTAIRAVRALEKKGDEAKRAIPVLVMLIGLEKWSEPDKARRPADYADFQPAAAKLLVRLAPESVGPLAAALVSQGSDQRKWAAWALGEIGPTAADAMDVLLAAVHDDMWFVGQAAAHALTRIGCPAERLLPEILGQADVVWMGEGWADDAIFCADADPDGNRKLVDAFVAGAFEIRRGEEGLRRGLEILFAKRGGRLAGLLASAVARAPRGRRVQIVRAVACCIDAGVAPLGTWIDGDDAELRITALTQLSPWSAASCRLLTAKIAKHLACADARTADAAEAALAKIGSAATEEVEAFLATLPATNGTARERAARLLERWRAK